MDVVETSLPGVLLVDTSVSGDSEGGFMEVCRGGRYRETGIRDKRTPDNTSLRWSGVLQKLYFRVFKLPAKHPVAWDDAQVLCYGRPDKQ